MLGEGNGCLVLCIEGAGEFTLLIPTFAMVIIEIIWCSKF